MPRMIETYEEFVARNGGNPILCERSARIFFPSGASCDMETGGTRYEAVDEVHDLKGKLHYLELKKERINSLYRSAQGYITQQAAIHAAGAGHLPDEQVFSDLVAMRRDYVAVVVQIRDMTQKLDAMTQPRREQLSEEREHRHAAAANAINRMKSITGDNALAQAERVVAARQFERTRDAVQAGQQFIEKVARR